MNSAVITAVPEFGRSAGEQIRAALLALPPEGGTIDARAFSAPTGLLRERLGREAAVLALNELTPFDATGWIKIDSEVLQLAGREPEQLRIANRGCFGTAVVEHAAGAPVEAFHLLDRDLFAGVPTRPVRLLLGPATFHVGPADARSADPADWALAVQHPSSGVSIEFDRTRLRAREALDSLGNSLGATRLPMLFSTRTTGTLAAAARGDRRVVPRSLAEIDPGDLMIIFGHLPRGGRDTTRLTAAVTSSASALPVASAGMLPESGYVMVGDELIHYGGVEQSGTDASLVDCRRGYGGTPAAAHPAAATVDRCVYEKYTVAEVTSDGAVLLDRPLDSTFIARAGAIDVITGSRDITFGGVGELDGARGPEDTVYNGIAIFGRAVRRLQVGGGIYFHDWDHGGVMLGPALECQVDGWYKDIGWRTPQLGAAIWLFRNASHCVVAGQYGNCNIAVALDDRSTHAHLDDNPSDENVVIIRNVRGVGSAVVHSGACHNAVVIESLADWDVAGIAGNAPQWSTEPVCGENLFQIGRMERGGTAPPGTAVELSRAYAYARNVVRFRANPPAGTVPPGVFVFGPAAGIAPFTGGLGAVPDPVIIVSHQAGGYLDVASPAAAGMPILVVILRNPGAAPLQGVRWPRSLRPARVVDPPGPGRWRVLAFAWDAAARHWGELVRSPGDLS